MKVECCSKVNVTVTSQNTFLATTRELIILTNFQTSDDILYPKIIHAMSNFKQRRVTFFDGTTFLLLQKGLDSWCRIGHWLHPVLLLRWMFWIEQLKRSHQIFVPLFVQTQCYWSSIQPFEPIQGGRWGEYQHIWWIWVLFFFTHLYNTRTQKS